MEQERESKAPLSASETTRLGVKDIQFTGVSFGQAHTELILQLEPPRLLHISRCFEKAAHCRDTSWFIGEWNMRQALPF